ncbi:hypothetical protein LOK49_LG07G01551 [Camellia lanceoleosa]|uniref:Uncharacterized protein n=1 Tax=Camellia lanceoleosa TaxID=1840588 RepID=A0ACC0H1N3_9ERIC|nr:hypothetical protein LOK49_LG07G01551 [Camellia lanceoleosa]
MPSAATIFPSHPPSFLLPLLFFPLPSTASFFSHPLLLLFLNPNPISIVFRAVVGFDRSSVRLQSGFVAIGCDLCRDREKRKKRRENGDERREMKMEKMREEAWKRWWV